MHHSTGTKEFAPIVKALEEQGWQVEKTADGHYKAAPPDKSKPIVHFNATADYRNSRNAISQLKRSGFVWPPKKAPELTLVPDVQDAVASGYPILAGLIVGEAEPPSQPPTSKDDALDSLWRELKEAKQNLILVDELVDHCKGALEQAQKDLVEAEQEKDRALLRMRNAKVNFDSEFGC